MEQAPPRDDDADDLPVGMFVAPLGPESRATAYLRYCQPPAVPSKGAKGATAELLRGMKAHFARPGDRHLGLFDANTARFREQVPEEYPRFVVVRSAAGSEKRCPHQHGAGPTAHACVEESVLVGYAYLWVDESDSRVWVLRRLEVFRGTRELDRIFRAWIARHVPPSVDAPGPAAEEEDGE